MSIIAVWSDYNWPYWIAGHPGKILHNREPEECSDSELGSCYGPGFSASSVITLILARPLSAGIMFWPRLQSHHFHHKHLLSLSVLSDAINLVVFLPPLANGQFHMWEIPTPQWWPSFVFIGKIAFCRRHSTSNPLTSNSRWAAVGLKATKILRRPGLSWTRYAFAINDKKQCCSTRSESDPHFQVHCRPIYIL